MVPIIHVILIHVISQSHTQNKTNGLNCFNQETGINALNIQLKP